MQEYTRQQMLDCSLDIAQDVQQRIQEHETQLDAFMGVIYHGSYASLQRYANVLHVPLPTEELARNILSKEELLQAISQWYSNNLALDRDRATLQRLQDDIEQYREELGLQQAILRIIDDAQYRGGIKLQEIAKKLNVRALEFRNTPSAETKYHRAIRELEATNKIEMVSKVEYSYRIKQETHV